MQHFRFGIMFSAALSIGIVACTKPDRESRQGGASFEVTKVRGSAEAGVISEGAPWRVATSVNVGVLVCMKDAATQQEARHADFFVSVPGTALGYDARSDQNGCIRWSEDRPFNHYAGQSGWVTLRRTIVGRGVYSGQRTVSFAVNPWAVGEKARDPGDAVIDMNEGKDGFIPKPLIEPERAEAFLAGDHKSQGASDLIIQDVHLKAMPEGEGSGFVTLTYVITMEPRIRSKRANGAPFSEAVPDGDFNVWMQLLSTNVGPQMDQKVLILGGNPFSVAKSVDGKLRAEVRIRQVRQANQGNLELAIKVAPRSLSGRATIRPFNGLFRLGFGTTVKDADGPVKNVCLGEGASECDYTKVVTSASGSEDLEKAGYLRPRQRYIFSNLKLRFHSVQPGETATQRTVGYTASTCITDTHDGSPLANTPLTIRYIKTPDQNAEVERDVIPWHTDSSGCLNWNGFAFHKYYGQEKYFERVVSIEKASGLKEQFTFYLNPWDTNVNFGFDSREFTKEQLAVIQDRPKIPSRFFLGGYQYHTVRFLYNIDPFMELEVKKTILLELIPEVLRYSAIKDARKMTEHLRDGIYLLKVAIQKSYLDPRANSNLLIKNADYQAEVEVIGDRQLKKENYITTNVSLVRVVSGLIIVPIELTMRDLRLMRVRSNFLFELQTVDERLVQAFQVLQRKSVDAEDLAVKLKEYRDKVEVARENLKDATGKEAVVEPLKPIVEERDRIATRQDIETAYGEVEQKINKVRGIVGAGLAFLKERFDDGGPLGTYLNSSGGATAVPHEVVRDAVINDNFKLNDGMLKDLKTAMNINDFNNVKLPTPADLPSLEKFPEADREKMATNLDIFVEDTSGLARRTFVGPVIFLSNTYSDSARATDNLDEERCSDPTKPPDVFRQATEEMDLDLREKLLSLGLYTGTEDSRATFETDADLKGKRQNNAYKYNKFFGSLRHLCYQHVDDLITEEKAMIDRREMTKVAIAMKSNFIDYSERVLGIPLEFVSMTDEPLKRLKAGCANPANKKCLEDASTGVLPSSQLESLVNTKLSQANSIAAGMALETSFSRPEGATRATWSKGEFQNLFYSRSLASKVGLCNLLVNQLGRDLLDEAPGRLEGDMRGDMLKACLAPGGLIHDVKLHVQQTGNYKFLGGLNLNINVGESFSSGWSSSWSAGLELADFVGVLGGGGKVGGNLFGAAGMLVKPASVKLGTSMSDSEGTSVSESTYLVSQIASFRLDLINYERCAVIALGNAAAVNLLEWWDPSQFGIRHSDVMRWIGLKGRDYVHSEAFRRKLRRGLFVCEGSNHRFNPPMNVKEMYFYFTQHFTEGDMLDQADLYNHPWLLGMRGMRDFISFVHKIRGKKIVGLGPFLRGLIASGPPVIQEFAGFLGVPTANQEAWALGHMSGVYQTVLPSFPGYYTVLDHGEAIQASLLEQTGERLSKIDRDPLGEVIRRNLKAQSDVIRLER